MRKGTDENNDSSGTPWKRRASVVVDMRERNACKKKRLWAVIYNALDIWKVRARRVAPLRAASGTR